MLKAGLMAGLLLFAKMVAFAPMLRATDADTENVRTSYLEVFVDALA